MADKVLAALTRATAGVLFPSETDAPFEPFVWGEAKNTAAAVRRLASLPRSARCQQVTLDDFFGELLEESAFQALRAVLEATLSDVKVYRCGSIKVTYFVVGTDGEGRLAGLK